MALQGTLDTFALADLVRLLATTSKTGELAIDGDRGSGRLWFADGQLVGGEPAGDDLADAVFALLRTQEGDFAFHADVAPDGAREPRSALDVLATAEARLEEWRPIEELVPSPAVALTLRDELPADEVTISRDLWARLVAIGGGTTAGALGEALGLDEHATGFAVRDLVDAGLVEVGDVVEDAVEPDPEPEPVVPVVVVAPVVEIAPEPEPVLDAEPDPVVDADPLVDADPVVAEAPAADPVVALGVEPEPPYSFGRWGEGPVPAPETQVDPAALGPWEPLTPPVDAVIEPAPAPVPSSAPEPLPALDEALPSLDAPAAHDDLGSYAVDLDSQLGGVTAGHSYLGTAEGGTVLPEPLLGSDGIPDSDAAVLSAPPEPPAPTPLPEPGTGAADELAARRERAADDDGWSAPAATSEDLGVPLDSLSPAAARALAAAASADAGPDDDTDAGRRVLRRIISTGKG